MRLAKYLAHAGVASRRAAEELVREGRVRVGGKIVRDPAKDVNDHSRVEVDGEPLTGAEQRVVIALHKPAGVVSTARDTHGRKTVVEMVGPDAGRLYPVGRLDADTTGLILLTNDGDLANRLMHPRHGVPKTYRATLGGGAIDDTALRRLRKGIELDDGKTSPAVVRRLAPDTIELTIREGRKRQVKRMCQAVGHRVRSLERVAFGTLVLGDLAPGEHRELDPREVESLRRAAVG